MGDQALAMGNEFSIVLKGEGTVWTTGRNNEGQLGDGTDEDRLGFVQARDESGFITGVKSVAAGNEHSIVLKGDGTVWLAGKNDKGQLGDGTQEDRLTFVQAKDSSGNLITDAQAVSAGRSHSLVVKNDGTVWSAGYGEYGSLGDGTNTDKTSGFVQCRDASGFITEVQAISTTDIHTVVMKQDGTMWGTGFNHHGELGLGHNTNDGVNHFVEMPITGVKSFTAGFAITMVVKDDGTVWGTGKNGHGEIGDDSASPSLEFNKQSLRRLEDPVQVVEITDAKEVGCGYYHCTIVMNDGTAWAAGENNRGQIAQGATGSSATTYRQCQDGSGAIQDVESVARGSVFSYHMLVLKNDGTVWATGINNMGQLGNGNTEQQTSYVQTTVSGAGTPAPPRNTLQRYFVFANNPDQRAVCRENTNADDCLENLECSWNVFQNLCNEFGHQPLGGCHDCAIPTTTTTTIPTTTTTREQCSGTYCCDEMEFTQCCFGQNTFSKHVSSYGECEQHCASKLAEGEAIAGCEMSVSSADRNVGGVCYAQTVCNIRNAGAYCASSYCRNTADD